MELLSCRLRQQLLMLPKLPSAVSVVQVIQPDVFSLASQTTICEIAALKDNIFQQSRRHISSGHWVNMSSCCCCDPFHGLDLCPTLDESRHQDEGNATCSSAWTKSSNEYKTAHIKYAMASMRSMEAQLPVLDGIQLCWMEDGRYRNETAFSAVKDRIKATTDGMRVVMKAYASTHLFNEYSATGKQHRALDVPELREMILDLLSIPDLLRMMQVSKTMHSSIQHSAILQKRLQFKPTTDGFFRTLLDDPAVTKEFTGFKCHRRKMCYKCLTDVNKYEFPLTVEFKAQGARPMPRIGLRCREILIASPPIYEMEIFTSCCNPNNVFMHLPQRNDQSPPQRVKSMTGLTIGDLYDAAQRHRKDHAWCRRAQLDQHDDDGIVKPAVSFCCNIKIEPGDPIVKQAMSALCKDKASKGSASEKQKPMLRYIEAKRQGKSIALSTGEGES